MFIEYFFEFDNLYKLTKASKSPKTLIVEQHRSSFVSALNLLASTGIYESLILNSFYLYFSFRLIIRTPLFVIFLSAKLKIKYSKVHSDIHYFTSQNLFKINASFR
jgi:hypothetical protein